MSRTAVLLLGVLISLGACTDENGRPIQASAVVEENPGDDLTAEDLTRVVFRDIETGSLWNQRGEAIAGSMRGEVLAQDPRAHSAYWFAWASFWPETAVWGDGEDGLLPNDTFGAIDTRYFVPDLPPDAIPPLEAPKDQFGAANFVLPAQAHMLEDEIVVGFSLDDEAFAYPVRVLNFHEIVHHEVAGRRVMVTYCPLTASGLVYDPGDDWFGNTGGLYNNNMVMYDRATRSFWSQMAISSILGDREGELLPRLPSYQGTWAAWLELFPQTLVLSSDTGFSNRNYAGDIYIERRYTTSDDVWFFQEPPIDRRYPLKDPVLGLVDARRAKAYPFSRLREVLGDAGVVNDSFGDEPVLIVFDGGGHTATAFSRTVAGRTLRFEVEAD